MPTLHMRDAVAGVDSTITAIPQRLLAIDVEPPASFLTAIREGQWTIPEPNLTSEVRALSDATTEAEFQKAVEELAAAQARSVVIAESVELRAAVTSARSKRVIAAFEATSDDMLDAVIGRYNQDTDEFTAAALSIPPNLDDISVLDLDEASATSIRTAKVIAERMNLALDAYRALFKAMKFEDRGTPTVAQIGEFTNADTLVAAIDIAASHNPRQSPYRPFWPHYPVVAVGGKLRLAHPRQVETRVQDLYAEYSIEVPTRQAWGG